MPAAVPADVNMLSVFHIQDVRVDIHGWKPVGHRLRVLPVCRRPPTIQETGLRKHVCAEAQAHDLYATRVRLAQCLEQALRWPFVHVAPAGDHDRVGLLQCVQRGQVRQAEACRGLQGRWLGCANNHLERRITSQRVPEHDARNGQVEGADPVEGDDDDAGPWTSLPCTGFRWKVVGPILSTSVIQASRQGQILRGNNRPPSHAGASP